MFIKDGNIPCDYVEVSENIGTELILMKAPLLSITDDGKYCFSLTRETKEKLELISEKYGKEGIVWKKKERY